ncbi:MAG: glycerophosphoryl diester phosphodiesterase membrane domain-containing protein [Arachnia sp.]
MEYQQQADFPPSPLQLGGTFSTAFRLLGRYPGLWIALVLLPMVGNAAVFAVLGVFADHWMTDDVTSLGMSYSLLTFMVGLASLGIALRFLGASFQGVLIVAQGHRPTIGSALSQSRGFVGRMAPLLVIGVFVAGGITLAYSVYLTVVVGVTATDLLLRPDSLGSNLVAFTLLMIGSFVVLSGLMFWLSLRLYYLLPVLACEPEGSLSGMSRAWRLTRGEFWRTAGYTLLGGALSLAPFTVIFVVWNGVLIYGGIDSVAEGDLSQLSVTGWVFLVLLLVSFVLGLTFAALFQGVMYVDRVRRDVGDVPLAYYPPTGYGSYPAAGFPGQDPGGYPPQSPGGHSGYHGSASPAGAPQPPGSGGGGFHSGGSSPTEQPPPDLGGSDPPASPWARPE